MAKPKLLLPLLLAVALSSQGAKAFVVVNSPTVNQQNQPRFIPSETTTSNKGSNTHTALHLFGIRRWLNHRRRNEPHNQDEHQDEVDDDPNDDAVRGLFHLWNKALATGNSTIVAQRYAPNAVLLPTVSNQACCDPAAIQAYFDHFLTFQPQGNIRESHVHQGDGWCSDTGIYEFTMGATGDKVTARYSFLYVPDAEDDSNHWKILHHHSSVLPETHGAPKKLDQNDVRDLFHLWNNALQSQNPQTVAARYTKDAVLLPTLSDTPRTDQASIEAYFYDFLKKRPRVHVQQSSVRQGTDWLQDVGIYTYTLGGRRGDYDNNDKHEEEETIEARYSFIYVWEEGEWKIAHHHSSLLPEEYRALKDEARLERAARDLWNEASLDEKELWMPQPQHREVVSEFVPETLLTQQQQQQLNGAAAKEEDEESPSSAQEDSTTFA